MSLDLNSSVFINMEYYIRKADFFKHNIENKHMNT